MKKSSLLKMKNLPATEEMRARSVRAETRPIDADTAVLHEVRWRAAF